MNKIITSHDYPPIPTRDFDWSAFREDYEPRLWGNDCFDGEMSTWFD
jgi:hypothetical protein